MKKIVIINITLALILISFNFLYSQKTNKTEKTTKQEYIEEESSGVMVDSDMDENISKPKSTIKKSTSKTSMEYTASKDKENLTHNFKEYDFKNFKIKIPDICPVKMQQDKTSAVIGGEDSQCFFGGKLSQINKKKKMSYLINMYKNKCKIKKSQTIMKKWIKNEGVEGYFTICASERADFSMELNSNEQEILYQFTGNAYKVFSEAEKKAFMYMLNSIQEK